MLKLSAVTCHYGRAQALHGLDLSLGEGEVVALLGRNGAGKTTTLKCIMGLLPISSGAITFGEQELHRLPAHAVPALGIGYVPQGRRLFAELSVAENLRIGRLVRHEGAPLPDWILELFPRLLERENQRAGSLSGGEQQMLAVARALAIEPSLLLMDEPSEGLMPAMVAAILESVKALKARGVAVILVEQKVEAALAVADRIGFIEEGRVAAFATPEEIEANPELLRRHVGVGDSLVE